MTALLDDDLARDSAEAGAVLDEYSLANRREQVWRFRLDRIAAGTAAPRWLTRAAADPEGVVVGCGGFHGPPGWWSSAIQWLAPTAVGEVSGRC